MKLFEARHISVGYVRNGETSSLLHDVNLSLEAGGIYDLIGPSGAGKSTLLRVLARMLPYREGELLLGGNPSSAFSPQAWRRQVALVPQRASLVAGTVRDNLVLPWTLKANAGSTPPSDEELTHLLEQAALDVGLDRDTSQLSGGQAARVALLRTFATRPQVLLLDEVDAALDDATSLAVSALTREVIGKQTCCLRIRHRASDGLACGVFALSDGDITYRACIDDKQGGCA